MALREAPSPPILALEEKISARTAVIVVIGMGYVGLPLAVEKAKVGFTVIGIEQKVERMEMINAGQNYISDVEDKELAELVATGKIRATDDYSVLAKADVIIICVPTPLDAARDPDISYIISTTKEIAQYLRPGQMVVLESTTFPGTTEEVVLPILAASGLEIGVDYFLAFSPERVDPGNKRFTTKNISKVVGGVTENCLKTATALYSQTIMTVVPVSSPKVAEMTKVFENTFRAVNIALVNELALLCDKMGISVWEVVDAAATKPFGMMSFYPGPGVGGHCIPVDPFYLTWKARQYDFHTRFIELAGEVNLQMPLFVMEKINKALNQAGKCLRGAKILILGVAYKKDIDDARMSPGLEIMELLIGAQAKVIYSDPFIPSVTLGSDSYASQILESLAIESFDCIVLCADHSAYPYEELAKRSKLIIDTRNAFAAFAGPNIVGL